MDNAYKPPKSSIEPVRARPEVISATREKEKKHFVIRFNVGSSSVEVRQARGLFKHGVAVLVDGEEVASGNPANDGLHVNVPDGDETQNVRILIKPVTAFGPEAAGLAIYVGDIPVEGTAGDLQEGILQGKQGLLLYVFLLGLKLVFTGFNTPFPDAIAGMILYLLPIGVLIFLYSRYERVIKTALIIGSIIALLELADFIFGFVILSTSGQPPATSGIVFSMFIRYQATASFIKAYRALRAVTTIKPEPG